MTDATEVGCQTWKEDLNLYSTAMMKVSNIEDDILLNKLTFYVHLHKMDNDVHLHRWTHAIHKDLKDISIQKELVEGQCGMTCYYKTLDRCK